MFGGSSAWGQQNNQQQQQQQGQQQQPAGGGLFGGGAPAAGGFGSTGGTSPLPASLALLSSASPQEGWVTIPGFEDRLMTSCEQGESREPGRPRGLTGQRMLTCLPELEPGLSSNRPASLRLRALLSHRTCR